MMNTHWIAGALTALVCGASGVACHGHDAVHQRLTDSHSAHFGRWHGGSGHSAGHLDEMADMLELTSEQRVALAAVLAEQLPNLRTRAGALASALESQLEQVHSEAFDEAAIRQAAGSLSAANAELAVAIGILLRDVHGELTPEQLARVAEHHGSFDFGARAEQHMDSFFQMADDWAQRQ